VGSGTLAAEMEWVRSPKALTDRAVDTSSVRGMVEGVVRPGMEPHEKLLALYQHSGVSRKE
jgi:hypothetical protein